MRKRVALALIYSLIMGPLAAQEPPSHIKPQPGQTWTYSNQQGWGLTDKQDGIRFTTWYGGTNRQYPVASGGAPIQVGNPGGGVRPGGGGVVLGGSLYYNPSYRMPPSLPPNANLYRSPFLDLNRGNWAPRAHDAFRNIVLNPQLKAPELKLPMGSALPPDIKLQKEWIESIAATLTAPATAPLVSKYLSGPLNAVADRNPFALAESMDGYMAQVAALDQLDPKMAQDVIRIGQSVFMDSQGVISGLPDAPRPVDLVSPMTTDVGRAVRGNLNRMLVARQIFEGEHRMFCEANPKDCVAQELQMEQVRDMFDQLALLHVMAERIGLANDPAFQILKHELDTAAAFTFGVAKGVYGSVEEMVHGIQYLLTNNPLTTAKNLAVAVGDALFNYERTYDSISGSLGKKWDTFLYGSAVEQGEVLGQVTTEILTTLVPGLKGVTGAARALKAAATLEKGLAMAEKISLATKAGTYKLMRAAVERAATKVAVSKGVQEFVAKGALAAESAEMLYALNKVLPETAAQLLKLEQKGLDFAKLKAVAKESLKSVESAAQADAAVAGLISQNGNAAVGLLNQFGAEAIAGASKAFGAATLKTVGQWSKSPAGKEMAQMAKQIHRELAILPEATPKNLGNLFQVEVAMQREGIVLSSGGREFLVRQTLNADIILATEKRVFGSVSSLSDTARSFTKFEATLGEIKGAALTAEESVVWRGIPREFTDKAGVVHQATPSDVFRTHLGNLKGNHRFSQPGEMSLYTTMGTEESALKVLVAENTGFTKEALIFEKQTVQAKRVLDLTDKSVLDRLGISKDALISPDYSVTHQLGYLARKYGFDAVKSFSAKGDGVNLIIPKVFP